MNKLIKVVVGAAALVVIATTAWANCHTETYYANGKYTTCTVCWWNGNKTVNCY